MQAAAANPPPAAVARLQLLLDALQADPAARDRWLAWWARLAASVDATTLLADFGFDTYSTTIEARIETVQKNPDLVQRFVDATAIGWYNYIYGDNRKANDLIKKENPEMDDAQLAFSLAKMKEYGIVDSGDALTLGLGAMTDARMKSFFDKMVKSGVVKANIDYKKAYTLQFVNKKVGLDLRPKN